MLAPWSRDRPRRALQYPSPIVVYASCSSPFGENTRLVVLLRRDLPSVGTRLRRHRSRSSRRGEFRNDVVDVTATIADHKQGLYDAVRGARGDAGYVQVEHRAPCAVGINRVGAVLPPRR